MSAISIKLDGISPTHKQKGQPCGWPFLEAIHGDQARFLNSLVRVSISILSPISTKAATANSKPVLILAGFITLPEVSPRTEGSVYTTSRTMVLGSSTEIALSL